MTEVVTTGARVEYRGEVGTIVWIQPVGWMQTWTRLEAAGLWMDRLSDVCIKDVVAQGERFGRWLSKAFTCDHERPRAIVRLDRRTKRASAGVPAGSLRYAWAPLARLRVEDSSGQTSPSADECADLPGDDPTTAGDRGAGCR